MLYSDKIFEQWTAMRLGGEPSPFTPRPGGTGGSGPSLGRWMRIAGKWAYVFPSGRMLKTTAEVAALPKNPYNAARSSSWEWNWGHEFMQFQYDLHFGDEAVDTLEVVGGVVVGYGVGYLAGSVAGAVGGYIGGVYGVVASLATGAAIVYAGSEAVSAYDEVNRQSGWPGFGYDIGASLGVAHYGWNNQPSLDIAVEVNYDPNWAEKLAVDAADLAAAAAMESGASTDGIWAYLDRTLEPSIEMVKKDAELVNLVKWEASITFGDILESGALGAEFIVTSAMGVYNWVFGE